MATDIMTQACSEGLYFGVWPEMRSISSTWICNKYFNLFWYFVICIWFKWRDLIQFVFRYIILFILESYWGQNTYINHVKCEYVGDFKSNTDMENAYVNKQSIAGTAFTTWGAVNAKTATPLPRWPNISNLSGPYLTC